MIPPLRLFITLLFSGAIILRLSSFAEGESSSIFVRINTTTGEILSAQQLTPPLDLTKARGGLSAGQDFRALEGEPNQADILSAPHEWRWTGTAWQNQLPRIALTVDRPRAKTLTPGETTIPPAKLITLTGQIVNDANQPLTPTVAPFTLEILAIRGPPVLYRVRITSGVIESERDDGTWGAGIALWSRESGQLDLAQAIRTQARATGPLIVEFIRGRP